MSVMSRPVAAPEQTPEGTVSVLASVTQSLRRFLDGHGTDLNTIHPDLQLLADAARSAVLDGGKRLRPTFAFWGWRCVQPAGAAGEDALLSAAAGLELLHACALVHDDVMDASDTRRGRPAAHRRFGQVHLDAGWPGSAAAFGTSGAILLGDLLLSWAEELFTASISALPADRVAAAQREFGLMRTEVVAGQFLDVLAQTRGAFDPTEALRVIEFKTSKYTVERPLLLGAAAAGASGAVTVALSDYGRNLGEAFQLRDDLLGVFGDPSETGKPAGDDLREGKRTLLVALAAEHADNGQRSVLGAGIGNPDLTVAGVADLRRVLSATGAREAVERRIADKARAAEQALGTAPLRPEARQALLELAHAAAHRTF
jgi:geranylgeranyl diphosphate synthase type I